MNWVLRDAITMPLARTVAFGRETFVVSKWGGGIVQSDELFPVPLLSRPRHESGKVIVSLLTGGVGLSYTFQSTADWMTWSNVVTVIPSQFPTSLTNDPAPGARFFRVIGD